MRYIGICFLVMSYSLVGIDDTSNLQNSSSTTQILCFLNYVKLKSKEYGIDEFIKEMDRFNAQEGKYLKINEKTKEVKNLESAILTLQQIKQVQIDILSAGGFSEKTTKHFKSKIKKNTELQLKYKTQIQKLTIEILNPVNKHLNKLLYQKYLHTNNKDINDEISSWIYIE